jgi:broad specificity phosphatase PhoE
MEIVLARHGKPNLQYWTWITPYQMKEWIHRYNQADVLIDKISPDTLKKADQSVVVSSTLLRGVQSAQALSQTKPILTEEVFCEADLPYGHWTMPKLPFSIWVTLFRIAWLCGYSSNAESLSQTKVRARCAAERLVELAQENGSVFFVGHGIINRLIAKELLALGWSGTQQPANKYGQFSIYHAPV